MKQSGNQPYHILVVDDERDVRQAIKMLLEHDGHTARTVESGKAALALLDHDTFDLIVTDYSMEGMKGNELAATIKQVRPDQPIIMATAFAADFQSSGKTTGGVNCVLGKPFSLAELREAIASVMSPKAAPLPAAPVASASSSVPPANPPPAAPGESAPGRTRA